MKNGYHASGLRALRNSEAGGSRLRGLGEGDGFRFGENLRELSVGPDELDPQPVADRVLDPLASRWSAAREGLATWLFYDKSEESVFSNTKSLMVIYPHKEAESRPYSYAYSVGSSAKVDLMLPKWRELDGLASDRAYSRQDLGFNEVTGMGTTPTAGADLSLAYERIKNAVDRHTDWYASGYDDRKHWMLVFRVKKADWYTTQRMANSEPIDLGRMWFDETSFGTTGLAKGEHAWDRLGTALEGEYDSIVYLHNITKSHEILDDGIVGNP